MSMKCWMSKGDLIAMLGNDAFAFAGYLLSDDPTAKVINKLFEITPTSGVEMDEPMIAGLVAQLTDAGVIKPETKGIIDAWVVEKLTPIPEPEPEPLPVEPEPELPYRTYTVNVEGNINEWLNSNATPSGGGYIVMGNQVTLRGTLPSPAVEVK